MRLQKILRREIVDERVNRIPYLVLSGIGESEILLLVQFVDLLLEVSESRRDMAHLGVRMHPHRPVLRKDEFDIDHSLVVAVQHFIQFLIELRILGLERVAFDFQFFLLTHD